MGIPVDTYFIVTPGSEFLSKTYATLSGTDLFIYITETGSLRVVDMVSAGGNATPGNTSFALAQNAKWVGSVSRPGIVHIYFADNSGQMKYIPYTLLGGPVIINNLSISNVQTFSVTYTPQTTPQAYLMMTDDGLHHNLFAATDPKFQAAISTTQTYNNGFDLSKYVTRPSIAMHPADTQNLTVNTQEINTHTSASQVGFYVVKVPGLQ